MMKGWEFTYTHKPLRLVEKPDPVAKPGYVALDVKACGLCHSDVGAMEDEKWLALMKYPLIIGHEYAGVITEVGEGVTGYNVGDRVGVCPMPTKDGYGGGYGRDGGYATKSTAPVEMLVPIPDNVSFPYAAAATDAGMTSHHAVAVAGGAKPGINMGIIGIGGLGQIGTRVAVLKGANVYAASRNPVAREEAMKLGCKAAYSTISEVAEHVDLDVIVDFAGAGKTTADALEAVGVNGRVVLVGMAKLETTLNTMPLITKEVTILGSQGGNVDDIASVYTMMASGNLKPDVTEIGFDDIPAGLEKLKAGGVRGRLVAVMDK
ncbi:MULTISPECIES: zinc-binding dehydrogenase [unclassified Methanoculleus]|uniref:zinc-binding dehydrogenase n=1 Tax=unclassified Methanoculleus TaxID=2619537 RepID=UPI0025D77351|nr:MULTISPECIES: zinc-binding dehydrogenase [unclassified Methanoculleus]MCK9318302.1 zinc-binding dehydrogenase [Methanoculleus sp.]MDD2253590.1 zinc-binding dehydrogenase [Methanoculleus sp.]MDD2787126.1 zinc-binding dehydrogenase [Methanoculleus sp.]MDD3216524.1 zinc-binding dehydrogenase [Methanoculleus sp.]MDD4314548.1 zinc-binding dehydrogenase [Methanoculleus sp.]